MIYFVYVISIMSALISILKVGMHLGRLEKTTDDSLKFDYFGIIPYFITMVWGLYLIITEGMGNAV